MSRIRTLKPSFWLSQDVQVLNPYGRLAFLYLISNSDDEGRLKTSAVHLARNAIGDPSPEVVKTLEDQLAEMEARGMVVTYVAGGLSYTWLPGWSEHQRVSHPAPSSLPAPPASGRGRRRSSGGSVQTRGGRNGAITTDARELSRGSVVGDQLENRNGSSGAFPRAGAHPSFLPSQDVAVEGEVVGLNGLGVQGEGPDPVMAVYVAWRATHKTERRLTEAGRAAIRARLKEYPLQDVIDAAVGWVHDDWPNRVNNNRLEDCLRPANFEKFRDWTRGINRPGRAPLAGRAQQTEGLIGLYEGMASTLREQGD